MFDRIRDIYWGYRFFRRRANRRLGRWEACQAAKRLAGFVETWPAVRDASPMFRRRRQLTAPEAFAIWLLVWCLILVLTLCGATLDHG